MTSSRKDIAATALTAAVVLTYAITHEGWNVWLIGDNHRWAAAVILVLGIATCTLGTPGSRLLAGLGITALVLAIVALITGSLTPLSLLVADIVVLWLLSTLRHLVARTEATPGATMHG